MATPVNPFTDSAASALWSGSALTAFRTQAAEETAVPDLMIDISKLDARIAAFEKASIPASVAGATDDYPFDRARLKREFLDEALALIIRASREVNHPSNTSDANDLTLAVLSPSFGDPIANATGTAGGTQINLKGTLYSYSSSSAPPTDAWNVPNGGTQVFDNQTGNNVSVFSSGVYTPNPAMPDLYLGMADSSSRRAFLGYSSLIDAAFAAGDALANQTLAPSQVVTGIVPTTVAGVAYDRIATYSDITSKDSAKNPALKQYLVSSDVQTDKATGATNLSSTGGGGQMLKLDAKATTAIGTAGGFTLYQDSAGVRAAVAQDAAGTVTALGSLDGVNYVAATKVSIPLSVAYGLGVTPTPSDANLPIDLDAYRFTGSDGKDYLIGYYDASAGGSDRVFTYKLDPAVGGVTNVKSMTAPEYLLHWNESRIKVLTGQLNFQKNIITELQTDLAQANDALAELQTQYAALLDTGASAATLKLSLFNATHSTAGKPFLTWDNTTTRDQKFSKTEWETVRVTLKNYIDRRSSEAQQATLDYQSTLNRYNSAYEIMGKLQEKLDNLVKNQLRNIT